MHVAGVRVRPGVYDRDDRPGLPLLRRVSHVHRARAVAEGAKVVGREPARAAELIGRFVLVGHDWVPHFWTVFFSMVRKIRFSTIKPMMMTVNSPANTAGMSKRLRVSKKNQPSPPDPDEAANTSSAAVNVRHAKDQPI